MNLEELTHRSCFLTKNSSLCLLSFFPSNNLNRIAAEVAELESENEKVKRTVRELAEVAVRLGGGGP